MGKKHIIQKTEEEMIKEGEQLQKALNKEPKVSKAVAVKEGKVYIFSSYNNTIVTLTDTVGNVLVSKSAGKLGFKGSKKSTPFAASKVAETLGAVAEKMGIKKIQIVVKGIGSGRESALRSIANQGF